ncbi:TAXI family TRAP transporter solute-binding subunit [Oceanibacterium hippocampi]|uniref:NMT1/THI5 like protein n=1 Tax=Oceanibacterium hippocampi TaxID=745714 RepID=A0A1Y5TYA8_9PROT|nr:TAXI family TRAP transporter solute-binding subunit [Oceanibacterium hippocampi]SLN76371.1 NMT1/THI5 like protein [Oceanibacterium hippocampi]
MRIKPIVAALGAAFAVSAFAGGAFAAEVKLPSTMAWTAYNTGTTGYNQSVAIGAALKDKYNVTLRVIPGKNDVSRLTPVRQGKAQFSANGIGTYFAQEGVFQFGAKGWGPQMIRMVMASLSDANLGVGVAADLGIKTWADLKGKRVAWVRGGDALNIGAEAMLACGDLTWDEVEKVEFPGYGASWDALVSNQADAAFASTVSGPTRKLEASPRGIFWPPVPHDDAGCWERIAKVAPYFVKSMGTLGSGGISADNPHEGAAYPYPILMTYPDRDNELVYSVTRTLNEEFDVYSQAEPAAKGWAMDKQSFQWVVPYHDGAIAYFKEIGVWTDAMQMHNDKLVERQNVLHAAWEQMSSKDGLDDEAFQTEWMKVRAAALEKAGFEPVWR